MEYKIAVIPGDGIGVDVIREAVRSLDKIGEVYGHQFHKVERLVGGCCIDAYGVPIQPETLELCRECDAILFGAAGGPKWDHLPRAQRPESGLAALRRGFNLFCNLRPAKLYPDLRENSPLKNEVLDRGLDLLLVRDLIGGIYFGERGRKEVNGQPAAWDTEMYTVGEVERIARVAFDLAMKRNKKLTSVDKANVLDSSRLWRETIIRLSKEYPEVELSHMYVDNCAMQLVRNPKQFDVIVTSNIFGDILSDEASMISGSIGMLASASLSSGKSGLYEPIHGSAPDIAGQGIANPLATILSVAMMLRYSLDEPKAAEAIEKAVSEALKTVRTPDIYTEGTKKVSTSEMGDIVVSLL